MADYTDGKIYAMTMGVFVQIMIDSGTDDVIFMQITEDTPSDENGKFARTMKVHVIPSGQIQETIKRLQPAGIHKVLLSALERGIVQ